MNRLALRALPVAAAVALAACASTGTAPVPAADLGLSKGPVLATPVPPPIVTNGTAPGEAPEPPAAYEGVPPVIPHAIADFVPITAKENACAGCHVIPAKEKGGPDPVPPSHYVDTRNAPGKVGTTLAGTRHVCVSCHVEATAAKPLVRNDFRP